jgi:hypothetical protein
VKRSLTVAAGVVVLGLTSALAPEVPGLAAAVGINGTASSSAARPTSVPATPAAATPDSKRLDVNVVSIPTLVPGQSGLAKVRVTNPVTGDIAVQTITGVVTGLHASCEGDLTTGAVVEGGRVLTRRGTSGSSFVFSVPVSFVDDRASIQDCQDDAYTITFTATGSGK